MCAFCQKNAAMVAFHMQAMRIFYALKVAINSMHDREKKNPLVQLCVCSFFSIVHVTLWSLQSGNLFDSCRVLLLKMGV